MSIYVQIDNEEPDQIASNWGYTAFVMWAEALPAKSAPAVRFLVYHGWEDRVPLLIEQLGEAIKSNPPDPDVLTTAKCLLKVIAAQPDAGIVGITNGMVEDDGTDDDDDGEAEE